MNDDQSISPDAQVVTEASLWIAQIESGDMGHEDKRAFAEWISRSPRHAAEARRMAQVSDDTTLLSELAEPLSTHARLRQKEHRSSGTWRAAWAVRWGLAATSFVVLVLVATFALRSPEQAAFEYQTAVGAYKEVQLDDGSVIQMNTDTHLSVLYGPSERIVQLHQGEAHFNVREDIDRPFSVNTSSRRVVAVGTAFVVRATETTTSITVSEGKVAVSPVLAEELMTAHSGRGDHQKAPVLLTAGQSFETGSNVGQGPIRQLDSSELRRRLAWRRGLIEFSDTPLSTVVAELLRYTSISIAIETPELAELEFGGMFPIGETDLVLEALEAQYGVVVDRRREDHIVLSRPPQQGE